MTDESTIKALVEAGFYPGANEGKGSFYRRAENSAVSNRFPRHFARRALVTLIHDSDEAPPEMITAFLARLDCTAPEPIKNGRPVITQPERAIERLLSGDQEHLTKYSVTERLSKLFPESDFTKLLGVKRGYVDLFDPSSPVDAVRKAIGLKYREPGFGNIAEMKDYGMTASLLKRTGLLLGFRIVQAEGSSRLYREDAPPLAYGAAIRYRLPTDGETWTPKQSEDEMLKGLWVMADYIDDQRNASS